MTNPDKLEACQECGGVPNRQSLNHRAKCSKGMQAFLKDCGITTDHDKPEAALTHNELHDWIFKWHQDAGVAPLESDINDLIWTVEDHLSAQGGVPVDVLEKVAKTINSLRNRLIQHNHRGDDRDDDILFEAQSTLTLLTPYLNNGRGG